MLETHVILGKMNASYISEVVHKLTKGQRNYVRDQMYRFV